MTYPVVELDPWEYAHAHGVGIARWVANWSRPDAPHYDKKRMEDDRTAEPAAAICELAVAKYLGLYWPGHVWHKSDHRRYRDRPDVEPNIEVRRVRDKPGSAKVRAWQVGKGLTLWAARCEYPELRRVVILGALPYDEAWERGTPVSYAPDTTRRVAESMLNRPDRWVVNA